MNTDEIYIDRNGQTEGPLTIDELFAMWRAGKIELDTLCTSEGADGWKPISQYQNIFMQRVRGTATPAQPVHVVTLAAPAPTPRERGLYIFLAIAFGATGVHNLYARRYTTAIVQFATFVLLFWTILFPVLMWFGALYEAATVKETGDGQKMT